MGVKDVNGIYLNAMCIRFVDHCIQIVDEAAKVNVR